MQEILRNSKDTYDFIEQVQMCIVFGYTALEAFTNLSIPDSYEFKSQNNKGIIEFYNKESIDRWVQLSTKISEILVDIYQTKKIKGINIWSNFIDFDAMRNEIIHQKSIEITDFYKKYFDNTIFTLCDVPCKIIKFFFEERKDKKHTDPLWPWIINEKNDFPTRIFDHKRIPVIGSGHFINIGEL